MTVERPNAVTLKGDPFTLVGPELKVGDRAPDFETVGKDLKPISLADTRGAVRVFSVVPSLETPVCDAQTRRFNEEAAKLPNLKIYTISMDLPFAQTRWCEASGVDNLMMLSDHRNAKFGTNFGTLIKELRLNSRAIFVIDEEDTLRHVEYVKEVADYPDYKAALEAVGKITGAQKPID